MKRRSVSLSQVRSDLMRIYAAAIASIMPARLIGAALSRGEPEFVNAQSHITSASSIRLLAVGKASLGMARAMRAHLDGKVAAALVIAPKPEQTLASNDFPVLWASHPSPDASSELAGRAVLEFAAQTRSDELLLLLLSGGASALMALPAQGITIAEKAAVAEALMRTGASIAELNIVRKHLSQIKGGSLLRVLRSDARVLSLILSDVPNNDLATIGSGPTVPDASTYTDAIAILKRRRLWGRVAESVRFYLERGAAGEIPETLKFGEPLAERATNIIIGDNSTAQTAAVQAAGSLGYQVEQIADLSRDAEQLARDLVENLYHLRQDRSCLIGGGEPIVTIKGSGKGGRAQHCALAASVELARRGGDLRIAGLFAGTDGIDGPTDAAGAIFSATTIRRAYEANLDPQAMLARSDSYSFFKALGDLIVIGPTGTNVSDLFIGIVNY
jgi:glycerate-2-kinase